MSPNVMLGGEWIHSIAAIVINNNAAAAPSMFEHEHCMTEPQTEIVTPQAQRQELNLHPR